MFRVSDIGFRVRMSVRQDVRTQFTNWEPNRPSPRRSPCSPKKESERPKTPAPVARSTFLFQALAALQLFLRRILQRE